MKQIFANKFKGIDTRINNLKKDFEKLTIDEIYDRIDGIYHAFYMLERAVKNYER